MTKKKVLIVEDDALLLASLARRFEDAGFTPVLAHDGVQGLDAFKAELPDAIVTDILMPGKDGLAMLEDIRKEPHGKEKPVVILTNSDDLSNVASALDSGVAAYIPKSDRHIDTVVSVVSEKLGKI